MVYYPMHLVNGFSMVTYFWFSWCLWCVLFLQKTIFGLSHNRSWFVLSIPLSPLLGFLAYLRSSSPSMILYSHQQIDDRQALYVNPCFVPSFHPFFIQSAVYLSPYIHGNSEYLPYNVMVITYSVFTSRWIISHKKTKQGTRLSPFLEFT